MIDVIYTNGDSFVAGVELADDILPGYPGLLDFPWDATPGSKHEKAKEWILDSHNNESCDAYVQRQKLSSYIINKEYETAFPNRLNNLTGIPVINHAIGGASMDRIVRKSISDLIELRQKNSNIVAIIGTTQCVRSEVPNYIPPYKNFLNENVAWLCMNAGFYNLPGLDAVGLKEIFQYKLKYEKEYHWQLNFYKNVIMLTDFCKLNKIKLIWVDTLCQEGDMPQVAQEYESCQDLPNFKNYANYKPVLSMHNIAEEIGKNTMCPSGHFSAIVHEVFAERLVKFI